MTDAANTSARQLMHAAAIGRAAGLRYVYCGNQPGCVGEFEDTRCASCSARLIARDGYRIREYRVTATGTCPDCSTPLPGRWDRAFSGQLISRPVALR